MKSTNKWQVLFASLIALVVLHACKKKEVESQPVNATIKKYFSYKPGTYWIYVDSLTGLEDSFAVVDNNTTQKLNFAKQKFDNEVAHVAQYHNGAIIRTCTWEFSTEADAIFSFPTNHFVNFLYPFLHDTVQFVGGITMVSANLSSYPIRGVLYDSLHQVNRASGSGMQPFHDNFFINKNIGVVKMSIGETDSTTDYIFELMRYKIVH